MRGIAGRLISLLGLLLSTAVACTHQDSGSGSVTRPTPPPSGNLHTGTLVLPIVPVAQQTEEWCWLASAEMIFRYYNVPQANGLSYQCGIMGAVTGPNSICFYNCAQCPFSSGSDSASSQVLAAYPYIMQTVYFPFVRIPQISASVIGRRLSESEVQQQIDSGRPIEIGITVGSSFSGQAGHNVLLVGYSATASQNFEVVINDPFPYDVVFGWGPARNPYRQQNARILQPGQYQVAYGNAANGLQWSTSIQVSAY